MDQAQNLQIGFISEELAKQKVQYIEALLAGEIFLVKKVIRRKIKELEIKLYHLSQNQNILRTN